MNNFMGVSSVAIRTTEVILDKPHTSKIGASFHAGRRARYIEVLERRIDNPCQRGFDSFTPYPLGFELQREVSK